MSRYLIPFNNLATTLINRTMREMGQDLDRLYYEDSTETTFWSPKVNISETPEQVIISADLPGIKQDDLSIHMEGNNLVLKGERKPETLGEGEHTHRVEKQYGAFQRSFSLPMTVQRDAIKASLKDGVLRINIPKRDEAKPKVIPIEIEAE
ncbi:MAG: Hsp20/alpha crystallin family protein [Bacteroidota bacterium]